MTVTANRVSDEPDTTYQPVGDRPELLLCGSIDLSSYWTDPAHWGDCCLVHALVSEYRAEIPDHLHVWQVPDEALPIPLNLADPDGEKALELDAGYGRPFAPVMNRRLGFVYFEGEQTISDAEYRIFPVARALHGLRRWCTAKHRGAQWWDHAYGTEPICWTMGRHLIVGGTSLTWAADDVGVWYTRAERLLDEALGKVWSWIRNDLHVAAA